jgi:hypothetical protein
VRAHFPEPDGRWIEREHGIIAYFAMPINAIFALLWRKGAAQAGDFRSHSPRFEGENIDRTLALDVTLSRQRTRGVALSWL